jgi:lipopolysaccharide biosynthesis glycosyltransferase
MKSDDNRVEVAMSSDQNYVSGLIVTAASMATYADNNIVLSLNILDGGINDETFDAFAQLIQRIHPNVEFRRFPVSEMEFADLPAWSGSRMTYMRLVLARLLPDVEFVIYCDVDFLWLRDVAELWKCRDSQYVLQSVKDMDDTVQKEECWFRKNGLPFNSEKYVCCGLSMYNLERIREMKVIPCILDFMRSHSGIQFPDQTAMNATQSQYIGLLPGHWQKYSLFLAEQDVVDGCVVHYAGDIPWKRTGITSPLSDAMVLWHAVHARVRGMSVWGSLAMFFSVRKIMMARLSYLMSITPVMRSVYFWLLKILGHSICAAKLKMRNRRFSIRRRTIVTVTERFPLCEMASA